MEIHWLIYIVEIPLWWIHDYPKDIQEKYFETHERVPTELFTPTVAIKKGCALLFALAGNRKYGQGIPSKEISLCTIHDRYGTRLDSQLAVRRNCDGYLRIKQ